MLARLWERLSDTGIAQAATDDEVRNIRIINKISAMVLGGCLFFGLYLSGARSPVGWLTSAAIGGMALVPMLLVRTGRLRCAANVFIYQYYFVVFLLAYVFGRAAAVQFAVMLVPAFAVIVLKGTKLWLHLLIGLAGAAICQLILFETEPLFLPPNPMAYEALMMTLMGLIFFMLIYFYKTETERLETLVSEEHARTTAANALLKAEAAERRRTGGRLKEANLELQRFASLASHDMKEPLRTISSFSTLLKRRLQPAPETAELLAFITDAAQRMARLLDDLIAFARAGSVNQPSEPVDLNLTAEQVRGNLLTLIEQKGARLDIAPGLPTLAGHPTLLTQLLQNLTANGLKFQPPGRPPAVEIFCEKTAGGPFRLTVRDNGIGIAPEHHAQIFEPFRRLHARSEFDGSGIGLATCQKIAAFYQGRIELESAPGKGTAFHVFLPEGMAVGPPMN